MDNQQLATVKEYTPQEVELIKNTIATGSTDNELKLFLYQAKRTQLDPLAGQLHFTKYNTKSGPKVGFITSIDGYRLIAERTGQYAGNDDYSFNDNKSQYEVLKNGEKRPLTATATVYRLVNGERIPFTSTVVWDSYYPGPNKGFIWDKMPFLMLGKCAEAIALRKAFPQELGGLYTSEEMDQSEMIHKHNGKATEKKEEATEGEVVHKKDYETLPEDEMQKLRLRIKIAVRQSDLEKVGEMIKKLKKDMKIDVSQLTELSKLYKEREFYLLGEEDEDEEEGPKEEDKSYVIDPDEIKIDE
ncbi:MAG TPA: phage recombination protein Bet [Candidatus Dojkabacteria bacterium]|nr:phage recombination protein Bet [Candidatus Dojkabacteria bacterium]HRP37275.1 phage recombination protein Bet [Candidatus Dojkabacteria bacterium]HRP50790.1 phage recombination protein Bet [Candidatus Dojkabacteria bacterium]